MPTLTPAQISTLRAYISADDISGFYGTLDSYGDQYAHLGKEVTDNNTWQGRLANEFAKSSAAQNNVDMSWGSDTWHDVNRDLATRYLDAYEDNLGETPNWQQVQEIHKTLLKVMVTEMVQ